MPPPSTKFYLNDKLAGKPWITRLPFPVHCVEKVTVIDHWRKTRFSSTYSYHHGYFDGIEREFRGFGRVEQVDVESYGKFALGNTASPYIPATLPAAGQDRHLVPHRRVLDRDLSQFEHAYFPKSFNNRIKGGFLENALPQPGLQEANLTADERREALRACKGMTLRQEVYELDVDALEKGEHHPVKLFNTACHNAHIHRLQPQETNRHAVFLVTEGEAVTYHQELDMKPAELHPDPRIAHTLNLRIDEYGNVQQSVAVVYPRLGKFENDAEASLAEGAFAPSAGFKGKLQDQGFSSRQNVTVGIKIPSGP